MKIIYTSVLGCPKTRDNKVITEKFENTNGFIDTLKDNLTKTKKLMFITNRWQDVTPKDQPADEVFNDYHYTNKEYAQAVFDSYKLSGIAFDEMVIVDCDYKGNFKQDVLSSDMIFVQGGHTPRGLQILKDLNFESIITKSNALLLLTSTATKLPATKVLSTHHGNEKEYEIEEGLNLCDYSIRPHFGYSLKEKLFNKKVKVRLKLIKDFSKHIKVYAIGGQSYILDDGKNINIYGDCHCIDKGKIKHICRTKEHILI